MDLGPGVPWPLQDVPPPGSSLLVCRIPPFRGILKERRILNRPVRAASSRRIAKFCYVSVSDSVSCPDQHALCRPRPG